MGRLTPSSSAARDTVPPGDLQRLLDGLLLGTGAGLLDETEDSQDHQVGHLPRDVEAMRRGAHQQRQRDQRKVD